MKHIDEIFGYGYGARRILFEERLWCLYTKNENVTYILHRCPNTSYALDEYTWVCLCDEEAPESIKTLYIIHRWDK